MKDWIKKNWKTAVLTAATAAAGAYAGPMAAQKVQEYLPAICVGIGAC